MPKVKNIIVQHPCLGTKYQLKISDERAKKIIKSHNCLKGYFSIESSFDILLENFYELEAECVQASLKRSIFSEDSIINFQKTKRLFSRRVINLLSSIRGYLDQLPQYLNMIEKNCEKLKFARKPYKDKKTGKTTEKIKFFKEITGKQYDSSFSYRLLEKLRNYTQHKGLPFGACPGSNEIHLKSKPHWIFCTYILLDINELLINKGLKAEITKELIEIQKDMKGQKTIEINEHIRNYIESLCIIHSEVRKNIMEECNKEAASLKKLFDEYGKLHPQLKKQEQQILKIWEVEKGIKIPKLLATISNNEISGIQYLLQKNGYFKNISKSFVSNQLKTSIKEIQNTPKPC